MLSKEIFINIFFLYFFMLEEFLNIFNRAEQFIYEKNEEDNKVEYIFSLPGVDKGDMEIQAEDTFITLKINKGQFKGTRKFYVKKDYESIKAITRNGILIITVEYSKPIKTTIPIE